MRTALIVTEPLPIAGRRSVIRCTTALRAAARSEPSRPPRYRDADCGLRAAGSRRARQSHDLRHRQRQSETLGSGLLALSCVNAGTDGELLDDVFGLLLATGGGSLGSVPPSPDGIGQRAAMMRA